MHNYLVEIKPCTGGRQFFITKATTRGDARDNAESYTNLHKEYKSVSSIKTLSGLNKEQAILPKI